MLDRPSVLLGISLLLLGPVTARAAGPCEEEWDRLQAAGMKEVLARRHVEGRDLLRRALECVGVGLEVGSRGELLPSKVGRVLSVELPTSPPGGPPAAGFRREVQSLTGLARSYDWADQDDRAEPFYRRALELLEAAVGAESPELVPLVEGLAWILRTSRREDEALALMERARRIREPAEGPWSPEYADSLEKLAGFRKAARDPSGQLVALRQALEIRLRNFGEHSAAVAGSHADLADALADAGKLEEAAGEYRRVFEAWQARGAPADSVLRFSQGNLARTLGRLGRKLEAERVEGWQPVPLRPVERPE